MCFSDPPSPIQKKTRKPNLFLEAHEGWYSFYILPGVHSTVVNTLAQRYVSEIHENKDSPLHAGRGKSKLPSLPQVRMALPCRVSPLRLVYETVCPQDTWSAEGSRVPFDMSAIPVQTASVSQVSGSRTTGRSSNRSWQHIVGGAFRSRVRLAVAGEVTPLRPWTGDGWSGRRQSC